MRRWSHQQRAQSGPERRTALLKPPLHHLPLLLQVLRSLRRYAAEEGTLLQLVVEVELQLVASVANEPHRHRDAFPRQLPRNCDRPLLRRREEHSGVTPDELEDIGDRGLAEGYAWSQARPSRGDGRPHLDAGEAERRSSKRNAQLQMASGREEGRGAAWRAGGAGRRARPRVVQVEEAAATPRGGQERQQPHGGSELASSCQWT
mmetsp:Transcript_24163/g.58234  ORF Transcript_24163/g.58234 Transcript_24163/m.58234 type:complete len:205 (+) Transcript_24163:876-1490(+)